MLQARAEAPQLAYQGTPKRRFKQVRNRLAQLKARANSSKGKPRQVGEYAKTD